MLTKTISAIVSTTTLFHASAVGADTSTDTLALIGAVNEVVAAVGQTHDIPAISVGLIHQGEVISYLSYGNSRRDGDLIDEASIYQIASLSKLLTGITIRQLILDGQIAPNGQITDYLAAVLNDEAKVNLTMVTVNDLLQHRSGIQNTDCTLYRERVDGEAWLLGYDSSQLIADLNNLQPSNDRQFAYSSCGYAVLGLIAELVSGKTYEQLLAEKTTIPFGMTNTVIQLDATQLAVRVTPYRKDDRAVETEPSILGMGTPGSGVYATVADLTDLQQQQLHIYRDAQNDRSSLMLTAHTAEGPDPSLRFGAGLIQAQTPMGTLFAHDGDADGYASFYGFLPEHNVGMVLLTSSGGDWVHDTSMTILTMLVDQSD